MRQSENRRKQNREKRSRLRTLVRNVLSEQSRDAAEQKLKTAVSYLDKMSAKGVIHRNMAARKKSQLTEHVNSL